MNLQDGLFCTSVYYKTTSAHSYLNYNSSHHHNTKSSIPYSQFLRLRRLCSDDEDFLAQASRMCDFFTARLYPPAVIRSALQRAKQVPREAALLQTPPKQTERPVVSVLYHPHNLPVCRILKSNWHLLTDSLTVGDTFRDLPLVAFKRDLNLRDILVRSSLKQKATPLTKPAGTFPCGLPNCKTCPHVCSDTVVQGPKNRMKITKQFTCQSRNLIYTISCQSCGQLYIGETGRTLCIRFTEHLADIRHGRDKPVAKHFRTANHSLHDVKVKAIWQIFGNTLDRKNIESHFIKQIGTTSPLGMNKYQ